MLRIRLRRVGKKKQPMYRIVVADSHAPRDGAFVENLGYYHPMNEPSTIVLDEERAKHWLDKGAMPSMRVAKILKIQGIAEVSAKYATRIALGETRKAEAKSAAAKKKAEEPAEAKAEAPSEAEAKAETPAAEAEAPAEVEAKAETPAAEAEAPAEAEAKAEEAPAEEAPAEDAASDDAEEKAD